MSGARNAIRIAVAMALLTGAVVAQSSGSRLVGTGSSEVAITNPVQQEARPWNFGSLVQSGFGVTDDRGTSRF